MMYKKKIALILGILTFLINVNFIHANYNNKTLIIYEREKVFGKNENIVNHLNELLYVFSKDVSKVSVDDYNKESINDYDYVFIVNVQNDIKNIDLLFDLSNYNNKIYWIGDKIENFIDYSKKYTITYDFKNNNINKLFYKDKSSYVKDNKLFNIINPSKESNIIATMTDGYNYYPYILNEDNLYYISIWDINDSYIFEDTLNDFYDVKYFSKNEVFIKLENINPTSNEEKLIEVANYLYSKNIPFIVSLTPAYINHKDNTISFMKKDSKFSETIKYMQEKGGSVILNGYLNNEDSFEFWDMQNDAPIKDINSYIKENILKSISLCLQNDIYPLGFEAPNDGISSEGYKIIKKYFPVYIGRYQNNSDNFSSSTFPYIIKNSNNFNTFIPENLGVISSEELDLEKIKENYYKLSQVRGSIKGISFPIKEDINLLKEIVSFFKDNETKFLDLKQEDILINIEGINIKSENGNITINYDKSKLNLDIENNTSKFESYISDLNKLVITFVFIILVLFLIIFIVFKFMNRRKFTRR